MLQLRLVVPTARREPIEKLLLADPRVVNVVVLRDAALDPVGDAVSCDVAREAASDIIARLRELGLDDGGTVAIQEVTASPSKAARRAEEAAPGNPDDGVVWDIVTGQAYEHVRPSWTFYVFLTLATMIASIAVIEDSSILVVGAMVVGPEYGAVAGVAFGFAMLERRLIGRGIRLLLLGFTVAILITAVFALLWAALGWIDSDTLNSPRPQTGFIWRPDHWSLVVAVLAGVAGTLSLTAGRTAVLVGVFISVTTVPAAGNLALALALADPSELRGSGAQLLLNLVGMIAAGAIVLVLQRVVWARWGRLVRFDARGRLIRPRAR
ncbi:DUF389 domain-containing protein [Angustibacter sp. McL0619]|uniref:DUF389 domain-containing protein n=1 Tax=Angustibacter sp. McL0619 TaxID=3415676 RepID=UPI003CF73695